MRLLLLSGCAVFAVFARFLHYEEGAQRGPVRGVNLRLLSVFTIPLLWRNAHAKIREWPPDECVRRWHAVSRPPLRHQRFRGFGSGLFLLEEVLLLAGIPPLPVVPSRNKIQIHESHLTRAARGRGGRAGRRGARRPRTRSRPAAASYRTGEDGNAQSTQSSSVVASNALRTALANPKPWPLSAASAASLSFM